MSSPVHQTIANFQDNTIEDDGYDSDGEIGSFYDTLEDTYEQDYDEDFLISE